MKSLDVCFKHSAVLHTIARFYVGKQNLKRMQIAGLFSFRIASRNR